VLHVPRCDEKRGFVFIFLKNFLFFKKIKTKSPSFLVAAWHVKKRDFTPFHIYLKTHKILTKKGVDKLSELYKGVILEHNGTPQYFEKRPTAQHVIEAYNPLCGDKFKLFLDIENGTITKATFHGYGCAISKAATSVLLVNLQEKTIEQAVNQIDTYFSVLDAKNGIYTEGSLFDENINAFKAVQQFPERMTCATLSWQAAKDFFHQV
jgi:nitrogen fixation protein NifU and related proteins